LIAHVADSVQNLLSWSNEIAWLWSIATWSNRRLRKEYHIKNISKIKKKKEKNKYLQNLKKKSLTLFW